MQVNMQQHQSRIKLPLDESAACCRQDMELKICQRTIACLQCGGSIENTD